MSSKESRRPRDVRLRGNSAVPGIVIGQAYVMPHRPVSVKHYRIFPDDVDDEMDRLESAVQLSRQQLLELVEKHRTSDSKDIQSMVHLPILDAYAGMLSDVTMLEDIEDRIRTRLINAEWAVEEALNDWEQHFSKSEDDYIKDRIHDIRFVYQRVIRNLAGEEDLFCQHEPPADSVIVAHNISPAAMIHLRKVHINGLILAEGGVTSHTVIMAKAFDIPTVVGVPDATQRISTSDKVIVDGIRGEIIVRPSRELEAKYRKIQKNFSEKERELLRESSRKASTSDGVSIGVNANIELKDEIDYALRHGADGVGLYRTEFIFLEYAEARKNLLIPEKYHYEEFSEIFRKLEGRSITVRTFDLGGEKMPYFMAHKEENPVLGLRSLRFALRHRELFRSQIRGILRAAADHPDTGVKVMFPLVATVEEWESASGIFREEADSLRRQGVEVPDIPLGMMMELPAAAAMTDVFASRVDFFSVGSNDFIQYSMAVDRGNDMVSYLYQPFHPGVLRLLSMVVKAASEHGVPVTICGEMGGELLAAYLLLGMGVREFSLPAARIPVLKRFLREVKVSEATSVLEEALRLDTHDRVRTFVRTHLAELMDRLEKEEESLLV